MLLKLIRNLRKRRERETLFRNFIFGVEDSLVSTVGLLSGVAVAGTTRQSIIAAGLVLIFVEAFSMGVGAYLSEETAQESRSRRVKKAGITRAALIMFFSYFCAGFIPLTPYLLFAPGTAYYASIAASLLALFSLGAYSATRTGGSPLKKGLEMLILGGLATGLGVMVGSLIGRF